MKVLLYALIFLFLTSCGMHSPMSELLMFQSKESTHGDSTYMAKYSHAIASFNTEQQIEAEVETFAEETFSANEEYEFINGVALSTHFIFMGAKRPHNIAFSAALGADSGIDLTGRVVGNTYLTGSFGMAHSSEISPQYQFILQQRLFDGNPVGLSVGTVLRQNYRSLSLNGNYLSLTNDQSFNSTSVGVRSVFTLSPRLHYGSSRPFAYATFSYNYDFKLETYYPKLGISVGIY